jgi:hypothetical protein
MPDLTANFLLPYPNGSDAPCDFAQQWCDFVAAINGVMGTFQAGIDRAIPVVPAALVRSTFAKTVVNTQNIPFDEVALDTAGMTDLDADPYHITITRPGRYTVGAYLEKPSVGIVNSALSLFLNADLAPPPGNQSLGAAWSILDRAGGLTYSIPAYQSVCSFQAGTRLSAFFNTGVAGTQTVDVAWLCAFWHSDSEVSV